MTRARERLVGRVPGMGWQGIGKQHGRSRPRPSAQSDAGTGHAIELEYATVPAALPFGFFCRSLNLVSFLRCLHALFVPSPRLLLCAMPC